MGGQRYEQPTEEDFLEKPPCEVGQEESRVVQTPGAVRERLEN